VYSILDGEKNKEDVHCTSMFTYIQLYLYLGHVNNIIVPLLDHFEIELWKSDFVKCMVRNCTDVLHSLSISADVCVFFTFSMTGDTLHQNQIK